VPQPDPARVFYLFLVLAMVASSIAARRIPMREAARYTLIWLSVFAAGILIVMLLERNGIHIRHNN